MSAWPSSPEALIAEQLRLAALAPPPWTPPGPDLLIGGVFVCFGRGESGPGRPGDPGWSAAALWKAGQVLTTATATGRAASGYEAGLLALREGPLLEGAVRCLPGLPDVLLVDATGRDHPRRAGLALHLGAVLDTPTVGVTHRPLVARGEVPGPADGDATPLIHFGEVVGYLVRARAGALPLAIHAGWRTTPETALEVARLAIAGNRTPEPLRAARQAAREARAIPTSGA